MQLVGATKKFIQLPFLKNSITISLISILIGNIVLFISIYLLASKVPEISFYVNDNTIQILSLIIVSSVITIFITLLSTWVCIRKYLNLKTHELYK